MASGTTPVDGKVFFREGGTTWAGTLANMSAVGENLNELTVEEKYSTMCRKCLPYIFKNE